MTKPPLFLASSAVEEDNQPIIDLMGRLEHWLGYQPDIQSVQDLGGGAIQVQLVGVGEIWLTVCRSSGHRQ